MNTCRDGQVSQSRDINYENACALVTQYNNFTSHGCKTWINMQWIQISWQSIKCSLTCCGFLNFYGIRGSGWHGNQRFEVLWVSFPSKSSTSNGKRNNLVEANRAWKDKKDIQLSCMWSTEDRTLFLVPFSSDVVILAIINAPVPLSKTSTMTGVLLSVAFGDKGR